VNKEEFLALIISNALICYQLSGTWEKYWEEFSDYFENPHPNPLLLRGEGINQKSWKDRNLFALDILKKLAKFIRQSKNNRRFVEAKIQRLEKVRPFLANFWWNSGNYYNDMVKLRDDLALTMWQKSDAKTIVFAVKMFYYWAKIIFGNKTFPNEIFVPIDSRLTNLFEKYKEDYTDINKFYLDLSKKLNIPMLHLDAILWVDYKKMING
jgi:DNA-(apurinic or apyrimidinic site) lyase